MRATTTLLRIAFALAAMAIPALALPGEAFAATLGTLASQAGADLRSFGTLLLVGCAIGGFCTFAAGLYDFVKSANQPAQGKGPALIKCIVGALLLGISYFINAVSGTFGGSGATTGLGALSGLQ
jgi:uncharacterized membrane protein